jgi:Lrp/AsnC family transcriptional regulator for asnA, asnC and gidA
LTRCDARWYNRLALRSAAHTERRGAVRVPRSLDGIDQAVIEALQKNGREPFRRIAADVGVSEATIRARYTRLCEDDILQVTGVTGGAPEPVADEISQWEEAGYVVITAGQFDILVELVCADRRQLLDVTNRMRELDGVVSTESFLYLELWKQLYDWGARLQNGLVRPARAS